MHFIQILPKSTFFDNRGPHACGVFTEERVTTGKGKQLAMMLSFSLTVLSANQGLWFW